MNAKQTNYLKIGLVVILAIVFVGVMANSALTILRPAPPAPPTRNASSADVHATPAKPVPAAHTAAVPSATPATEMPHGSPPETNKSAWPKFALEEIVAYDPFAVAKPVDIAASS